MIYKQDWASQDRSTGLRCIFRITAAKRYESD